jgi:hypothetical protein
MNIDKNNPSYTFTFKSYVRVRLFALCLLLLLMFNRGSHQAYKRNTFDIRQLSNTFSRRVISVLFNLSHPFLYHRSYLDILDEIICSVYDW